jgi:hypothetical protein
MIDGASKRKSTSSRNQERQEEFPQKEESFFNTFFQRLSQRIIQQHQLLLNLSEMTLGSRIQKTLQCGMAMLF